ncbi:MAG: ABC transporter permease subunit [Planctomycetota bacterium]
MAAVAGIGLGLAMGTAPRFYRSISFLVEFGRSTPVTTLYPLFVLLFGIGHWSKVAMVFAASVFVISLNTAYGVIHSAPARVQVLRLMGASRTQEFRWAVFPASLPQTMIGLRVALSYSLIVIVVCEMFMGSQLGVGQRVFEAYNTYAIADLYALVLLVGIMGYSLNAAFVRLEARLVPWVGA